MHQENKQPNGGKSDLQDLSERLQKAQEESHPHQAKSASSGVDTQGVGFALRAGIEVVVALLVGFGLGYFLDGFLGTRPVLMIIIGFLGLGAGVSNIYRMLNKMDDTVGYGKKQAENKGDKRDNQKK